jgi:hypothetical protein
VNDSADSQQRQPKSYGSCRISCSLRRLSVRWFRARTGGSFEGQLCSICVRTTTRPAYNSWPAFCATLKGWPPELLFQHLHDIGQAGDSKQSGLRVRTASTWCAESPSLIAISLTIAGSRSPQRVPNHQTLKRRHSDRGVYRASATNCRSRAAVAPVELDDVR